MNSRKASLGLRLILPVSIVVMVVGVIGIVGSAIGYLVVDNATVGIEQEIRPLFETAKRSLWNGEKALDDTLQLLDEGSSGIKDLNPVLSTAAQVAFLSSEKIRGIASPLQEIGKLSNVCILAYCPFKFIGDPVRDIGNELSYVASSLQVLGNGATESRELINNISVKLEESRTKIVWLKNDISEMRKNIEVMKERIGNNIQQARFVIALLAGWSLLVHLSLMLLGFSLLTIRKHLYESEKATTIVSNQSVRP